MEMNSQQCSIFETLLHTAFTPLLHTAKPHNLAKILYNISHMFSALYNSHS